MGDHLTTLYVTQYSAIRRALILVFTAVYLVFLFYYGRTLPPMEVSANIGTVAVIVWAWAEIFIRRTRFTDEGVEYRSSFGTKRFGRWPDVVVVEHKGKCLTIGFGNTELNLSKREADLNRLAGLLKNRASKYGYDV